MHLFYTQNFLSKVMNFEARMKNVLNVFFKYIFDPLNKFTFYLIFEGRFIKILVESFIKNYKYIGNIKL